MRHGERRLLSVQSCAPWGLSGSFACVRSIPVRHSLGSLHSLAPWGWSGSLVLRSVDSRSPWGSSGSFTYVRPISVRHLVEGCVPGSFWCVWSITVRSRGCRDLWSAFGRLPSALGNKGCVPSIPVRPGGRRLLSIAFCPFTSALAVIGCVPSIPVHPGGRSIPFCLFSCSLVVIGFVLSIPVLRDGRRLRSGAFRPFPCFLGNVGVIRFSAFPCAVGFVPVRHGGRRVSCAFGPFTSAQVVDSLVVFGFIRLHSVHSREP